MTQPKLLLTLKNRMIRHHHSSSTSSDSSATLKNFNSISQTLAHNPEEKQTTRTHQNNHNNSTKKKKSQTFSINNRKTFLTLKNRKTIIRRMSVTPMSTMTAGGKSFVGPATWNGTSTSTGVKKSLSGTIRSSSTSQQQRPTKFLTKVFSHHKQHPFPQTKSSSRTKIQRRHTGLANMFSELPVKLDSHKDTTEQPALRQSPATKSVPEPTPQEQEEVHTEIRNVIGRRSSFDSLLQICNAPLFTHSMREKNQEQTGCGQSSRSLETIRQHRRASSSSERTPQDDLNTTLLHHHLPNSLTPPIAAFKVKRKSIPVSLLINQDQLVIDDLISKVEASLLETQSPGGGDLTRPVDGKGRPMHQHGKDFVTETVKVKWDNRLAVVLEALKESS